MNRIPGSKPLKTPQKPLSGHFVQHCRPEELRGRVDTGVSRVTAMMYDHARWPWR